MSSSLSPNTEPTTGSVAQDRSEKMNGSGSFADGSCGTTPTAKFRMSDEEREAHIRDCAWLMEDAMRRWCETGDFGYRGEADRWRLLMEEAIKARSPEYVAKLERERGLA